MALGRLLWVALVELRAGDGGFIATELRVAVKGSWVGIRVRSKVTVRSGLSLGLGLGYGLILRMSPFSCWDWILGD